MLKHVIPVLIVFGLIAGPVSADAQTAEIEGTAVALDGATLGITPANGGKTITVRVWAIDAPDMNVWPWGPRSRGTLDLFLRNYENRVVCTPMGKDEMAVVGKCRMLAEDRDQELDIGEIMVRSGYAIENRAVGKGVYGRAETEAWRNNLGVWAKFWAK